MNKLLTYIMSVLIITVAAFIVFWFLIEDPYVKGIEDIDDKIKREEARYQTHLRDKDGIKKIEDQIDELKVDIFTMLCNAQGRSLRQFLKEVEDDADESSIKLESIRIESLITKELYSQIPLDFNVSGPYFVLYNFLARLQERGKMDFGSGQLSISQETKVEKINNLDKVIDPANNPLKYTKTTEFPRLRVTLNGEIIIIDNDQLERYKTPKMDACPDKGAAE